MEEQLISFETAKMAKKKGFDCVTTDHFDEKGKLYMRRCDYSHNKGELNKTKDCDAPTQSLLQKWLGEEKGVNLWVLPASTFGKDKTWWNSIVGEGQQAGQDCDTYEEALEAGLQEALKLI